MALSPDERRRYARHLSLAEIGEQGQTRLLATCFRLPPGAHGRAAEVARDYLTRAGLREVQARDDAPAVEVPLPDADEVARRARASALEPSVAALLGAVAAVETLKGVLGVGTSASADLPSPTPTE